MTAMVAFGVWGIWWQTVQLEVLNAELIQLVESIELRTDVTD